jgi:predicted amidophosphoribosyltransferase
MSSIREIRKANGQCGYCGTPLDRKGILCISCNTRWNEYKFTNYSLSKHNDGKCTYCGLDLDRGGWFCSICVTKVRLRGKKLADFRRANSLCVQCGVHVDGYSYCQKHRDERMNRYYENKQRKYKTGV